MNIELALIAVMLKTGDFGPITRGEITEDHFETDEGQLLHNFITTYRGETQGVATFPSLKIVRSRFKGTVELPDPDPSDTVANLSHETLVAKFRSDLRKVSIETQEVADNSTSPFKDVGPIMQRLKKAADVVQRNNHLSFASGFSDVVENYQCKSILPHGIPWPWPSLTDATKGLHRKEFIVICGRPKSRKSFTSFRIGTHAVKHHGARVLIFSPEMPPKQVMLRCVAHYCDLPYTEFKDSSLAEAEEARLLEAAAVFGRMKNEDDEMYRWRMGRAFPDIGEFQTPSLDIVQSTGRDTAWMASQVEQFKPDIIIADSFYRQRPLGGKRNDADWKAVSALSREMKDLVMELNVVGIGTHQLNRGSERSIGDLSNLALADAIGCDADAIYRVITGKKDGEDVSALINFASREVNFDGVMINNRPCYDYSERSVITNRKQVLELMKQEADAQEDDKEEVAARPADPNQRRPRGRPAQSHPGSIRGTKAVERPTVNMAKAVERPIVNMAKDVNALQSNLLEADAAHELNTDDA